MKSTRSTRKTVSKRQFTHDAQYRKRSYKKMKKRKFNFTKKSDGNVQTPEALNAQATSNVVTISNGKSKRAKRPQRKQKRDNSAAYVTPPPKRPKRGISPPIDNETPSSILDTARHPSRKGHKGKSVHIGNYYNRSDIQRRRVVRPKHQSNYDLAKALTAGQSPPSSPLATDSTSDPQLPKNRYCYCDYDYMVDCQECTENAPCQNHDGLYCSGCNDWFHASCTGWKIIENDTGDKVLQAPWDEAIQVSLSTASQPSSQGSVKNHMLRSNWYCIRCWETASKKEAKCTPWNKCSLEEKALRLGVPIDTSVSSAWMLRRINLYVTDLRTVVDDEQLVSVILNTSPRPFPTPTPMNQAARLRLARQGRRFEISLLCLDVQTCSCCGRTKPVVIDRFNDPVNRKWIDPDGISKAFHRKALTEVFEDAIYCSCIGICKGGQFYAVRRTKQKVAYTSNHPDQDASANSKLCGRCYSEVLKDNDILCLSRKLSTRNGFGPFPQLPETTPAGFIMEHPISQCREVEFHYVLKKATIGEEAAIRQITPLISLIRLKNGNISRKGVVTVVSQKSKLRKILPNLPADCKTVVFDYKKRKGMNSFRVHRHVIQRLLELFQYISHDVRSWDISISGENLQEWPEDGNLIDLAIGATENDQTITTSTRDDEDVVDDTDVLGPAPFQNVSTDPEEEFVGTTIRDTKSTSVSQAHEAIRALEHFAVNGTVLTTQNNETHVQQTDVLPTGDFVNMFTTPYAWSLAFPTLFPPKLIDGKWKILGDYHTDTFKDQKVSLNEWGDYLMWDNNGRFASHPTFALVLHSETHRSGLQTQGRIAMVNSDIDPGATVSDFRTRWKNPKDEERFRSCLQHFAGNITGTNQYWAARNRDFKATAFFLEYAEQLPMRYFLTSSMAEYYDPFLRRLLAKYVSVVEKPSEGKKLMTSEQKFHQAVIQYKQVVTHYFAYKQESWMRNVISPCHGVRHYTEAKEFAKGRGAIHSHGNGYSNTNVDKEIDKLLFQFSKDSVNALQTVDEYIKGDAVRGHQTDPQFEAKKSAHKEDPMAIREKLLKSMERGPDVFQRFTSYIEDRKKKLGEEIGLKMEYEFGTSAMHIGKAPDTWVRPGGKANHGYRTTCTRMMRKKNVLEKKVCSTMKFCNEHCLYTRRVDITNHCFTHQCSDYCWKSVRLRVRYDRDKHGLPENNERLLKVEATEDGVEMANYIAYDCRMGFGFQRDYAVEGNRTGGREAIRNITKIEFDKNGQPKFYALRNHPRVVQEPATVFHFGANCDIQRFLNCASTEFEELQDDDYDEFAQRLQEMGFAGLDPETGNYIAIDYTTGYACKGSRPTKEYAMLLQQLEDKLSNEKRKDGGDYTVSQLVGKHMYNIAKDRDAPKDECCYCLSGGKLVYSTMRVQSCSMNSIELNDLNVDDDGQRDNQSLKGWTYVKLRARYKQYAIDTPEPTNFFLWCAHHSNKDPVVPCFFGYNQTPSWPLDEDYSKANLILFKPFVNLSDLKEHFATWSEALIAYQTNPLFPQSIRAAIRRRRTKVQLDRNIGGDEFDNAGGINLSPTDERKNSANDLALNVAMDRDDMGIEEPLDSIQDAEFSETDLVGVDRGLDKDWSEGYNPDGCVWLERCAKEFYEKQSRQGYAAPLEYFDENIYAPENCQGLSQSILVALALHVLHSKATSDEELLYNSFVQGNPGTGKTFVIKTILNMVRRVYKNMEVAASTATTGAASSLSNGSTSHRFYRYPQGQDVFKAAPAPLKQNNVNTRLAFSRQMKKLVALINDEHSMKSRRDLAWEEHRCREGREDDRRYGGIPLVMILGDVQQLPPVGATGLYDPKIAPLTTADGIGLKTLNDFLEPPPGDVVNSCVVVMDKVMRQKDQTFRTVLNKIRNGTVDDSAIDFILSRRMDKLPEKERKDFEKNAIYIMPTWRRTKPIVLNYLKQNKKPIAIVEADTSGVKHRKHEKDILPVPKRNILQEQTVVQLQCNFIVESLIFNSATAVLERLVYENPDGPNNSNKSLPAYALCRFRELKMPDGTAFNVEDPLLVPIPVKTFFCEHKCCSIKTLPLRINKAGSTYKNQGGTVGKGHAFEKAVWGISEEGKRSQPGTDHVGSTRTTDPESLAVSDDVPVTRRHLLKLGQGRAYDVKRLFERRLYHLQAETLPPLIRTIQKHDSDQGRQSFANGFKTLLTWFRNFTKTQPPMDASVDIEKLDSEVDAFLLEAKNMPAYDPTNYLPDIVWAKTKRTPHKKKNVCSKLPVVDNKVDIELLDQHIQYEDTSLDLLPLNQTMMSFFKSRNFADHQAAWQSPMEDADTNRCTMALSSNFGFETSRTISLVNIGFNDIRTLMPNSYVSDAIINTVSRIACKSVKDCEALSHFVWAKLYGFDGRTKQYLQEYNVDACCDNIDRLCRGVFRESAFQCRNVFELHHLFMPIHLGTESCVGDHWALVDIDFHAKEINYLDSIQAPRKGKRHVEAALDILAACHKKQFGTNLNKGEWTLFSSKKCPQQASNDCGIFVLMNIYFTMLNFPLDYNQAFVSHPNIRRRLILFILDGRLFKT